VGFDELGKDFGGDGGEAGAVGGGEADAVARALDLEAVDFRGRAAGMTADGVAAGEERAVAGLRFAGARGGAEAAGGEEVAEAAGSAEEGGGAAAKAGVEIGERADGDEAGGVEGGVGGLELFGVEGVAEFEAVDGVGVAVEIDEEGEAVAGDGGGEGAFDGGVVFGPGAFGERVAAGGFFDFAVGVEFRAVEMARDDVEAMAGAREKRVGEGEGEFLSVEVAAECAAGAGGDRIGFEAAAVGRGDDEGEIADAVFDVAVGAEEGLAGGGSAAVGRRGGGCGWLARR
jgi:hypothetical protein